MIGERNWQTIYRLGATVALICVGALLFDIILAMVPGWGPDTTPTTAVGWFDQFAHNPWLGVRNLDLLNIAVSALSLPLYVALLGAHRRARPALALLGFVLVVAGTTLFVAANAALPMLQLSAEYARATAQQRIALEAAAVGLLARGAHGSFGAFPGFFLSELGTLVIALAMLRGGVFSRRVAWTGVFGATSLLAYSVIMTFTLVQPSLIVALAAPGGLAMIVWQTLVARTLWRLGRAESAVGATALPAAASSSRATAPA